MGADTRHNTSAEAAVVPLEHLRKKDGSTAVRVSCLSGGVPVYRTEVKLADLLQRLSLTTRGKEAVLFFSLSGGEMEGGKEDTHTYTALFCNGKRCGDGGAATPADTPHRRGAQPEQQEDDCQTKWNIFEAATAADWAYEPDGTDQEAVVQANNVLDKEWSKFEAATASDWACDDDGKDEDTMVQDRDVVEEEEEENQGEGIVCKVNESSARHSGECSVPRRPQGWRDVLGHIAAVVAVLLGLFNAWREYSRDSWE